MTVRRRQLWIAYFVCTIALLSGIGWASRALLRMELAEQQREAQLAHEGSVRLALWRMESWFAPLLGRETARPYFEYLPYYPQQRAYDSMFRTIAANEIQTPSPLLTFESDLFLLHFQVGSNGTVSSPQVPTGNALDLALATAINEEQLARRRLLLREVDTMLMGEPVVSETVANVQSIVAETSVEDLRGAAEGPAPRKVEKEQLTKQSQLEQKRRAQVYAQQSQSMQWVDADTGEGTKAARQRVDVGPFVPMWVDRLAVACGFDASEDSTCRLLLARSVETSTESVVQGLLVDWEFLRDELYAQIADLFDAAELIVIRDEAEAAEHAGRSLAQLPLALRVQPAELAPRGLTSLHGTLALVWTASLIAVGAVGLMLRSSFAYGDTRARFASAVTHELRTPLTTFRMYSEMLASGMVRDPEQQLTYLRTLQTESDRLAALVENVLAYAQLERGRSEVHVKETTIGALFEACQDALDRRAAVAGMEIAVDDHGLAKTQVEADVDVVRQVLLNLVDNACKYANGANDRRIHLEASADEDMVSISVADHGPGVPGAVARSIFHAFDRGDVRPGDPIPGLGLGLALARGLAQRMGGDLQLRSGPGEGARFALMIRLTRT